MAFGDQWRNRKYPDGCRSCGQTEKKHVGLGLCQNCYRDPDVQAAAREGTLEEPATVDTPLLDDDDLLPEFYDDIIEPTEDDIFSSGERRPGSITSPVSEQDGVTPPPKGIGSLFGKKKLKSEPGTPFTKKTSEKAPKAPGRRVSTAETVEDVWTAIGGVAQRTGRHLPLGRYLQWQAPAAGEMIDQALAGSFVDRRFLQPAVKTRGRLDVLAAVIGPPAIILAIEQNPDRANQLLPLLKSAIRSSLPTLLPAMKKAQAREDKVNKAVSELFGDDFPPGVDPVDVVLEQMFGGWIPPTPEPNYETTTDYADA